MIQRLRIGDVPVISSGDPPPQLPEEFTDCLLIFCHQAKTDTSIYKQRHLAHEKVNEVAFHKDEMTGNLFLTDFLFDQHVLSNHVDLIAFYQHEIKVFLGDFVFHFKPEQLHETYRINSFYETLFPNVQWEERSPVPKKRKRYTDVHPVPLSSESMELGLETISASSCSVSSRFQTLLSDEIEHSPSNSDLPEAMIQQLEIVPTMLDKRIGRRLIVDGVKENLKKIRNNRIFNSPQILLPTQQMILSKDIEVSNQTLNEVRSDIRKTRVLPDSDPIVVVENDRSSFLVLSGNMRVKACQLENVDKINVSKIDAQSENAFKIKKFLDNTAKDETKTSNMILNMRLLIKQLNVSCETLQTWNEKEMEDVFGGIFVTQKVKFLWKIVHYSDLSDLLFELSSCGKELPTGLLRDLFRKFKQDKTSTMTLLFTFQRNDDIKHLKAELKKVSSDLVNLLIKKKVTETVARELEIEMGSDIEFREFIRGGDLRALDSRNEKSSVLKRFETFKNKKRMSSIPAVKSTVSIGLLSEDFGVFLSEDPIATRQLLKTKTDIIVLLVGRSDESSSVHTLLLPDEFGVFDESGKMHNHVTLTIYMKKDWKEVNRHHITQELQNYGVVNKTVFTIVDLKPISKCVQNIFIDIGGLVSAKLAVALFSECSQLLVHKMHQLKSIQDLLQ